MRITIPPAEYDDIKFDAPFDIFKRKDYGERLANLIENTEGSPVFAIDSAWGEGKTTFLQMWVKFLDERETTSIYFDAFANDYQQDPFMAIASEIYGVIPAEKIEVQNAEQKKFTTKLLNAGYAFGRGALDVSMKLSTGGAVGIDIIKNMVADYKGPSGKEVMEQAFIDRLQSAAIDRQHLADFRAYLEEFAVKFGKGKPIVFIIDELDRCRPDFALELLEKIKHLFSVDGITFLLVTNRTQLNEFIKIKYGPSVDTTNYLHKFINLWLDLPKATDKYDDHSIQYFMHAFSKILGGKDIKNLDAILDLFKAIITHYRPSYREIERMLSIYAIFVNSSPNMLRIEQCITLAPIICYMKSCKRDVLNLIKNRELEHLLSELDITNNDTDEYGATLNFIANHIKFDLGSLEERKALQEELGIFRRQDRVMQSILLSFSGIKDY